MTNRITFEVVQVGRAKTITVRGVWRPFAAQAGVGDSLQRKVKLPEGVTEIGAQELWELASAIEAEILGWAAKLPLDY